MAPPATFEALVCREEANGGVQLVRDQVPAPTLADHEVLVKVDFVAQNPTDVQCFDINAFGDGAVLGCDFVGSVEKVGPNVTRVSEGSVIAGLIWGGEIKGRGGYSTYTVADDRICFPLPAGITAAEASTVPLAACTSLLALFSKDCLAIDQSSQPSVLIWGGSSSVGLYAIQIAALYGMKVVTTCSARHFDLVKSCGATHVFDYREAGVVDRIRKAVPDVAYVFDTIGGPETSKLASEAIRESGGTLCTVRPGKVHTENVTARTKVTDVLVWTAFLKDHQYKEFKWPANKDDHALSADFFSQLPAYIKTGKIKPNKPKVYEGGLDDVAKGFQEYRDGKISGYKIVYQV